MRIEAELPVDGSVIVFDVVPNGSYATAGIAYRVRRDGLDVRLDRVEGTGGTSDRVHAYLPTCFSTGPAWVTS